MADKKPLLTQFQKKMIFALMVFIGLGLSGLIGWQIYEVTNKMIQSTPVTPTASPTTTPPPITPTAAPTREPVAPTSAPTKSPTAAPTIPAPTSIPQIPVEKYCDTGTYYNASSNTCDINPVATSDLEPTINDLITNNKILPGVTINPSIKKQEWTKADSSNIIFVQEGQTVINNTDKTSQPAWFTQWVSRTGENCDKEISTSITSRGVGCACGDCAGWRGGLAIGCGGDRITVNSDISRVECQVKTDPHQNTCVCGGRFCPVGGLCVTPYKADDNGKIGCPACINTSVDKGGCAGQVVCDPDVELVENLVVYPGKRYDCKGKKPDNFDPNQTSTHNLDFATEEEFNNQCSDSNEYRGKNEYECAYDCIRKYDNQYECSKKCLPHLWMWGKVSVGGQFKGYYQLPYLTQYAPKEVIPGPTMCYIPPINDTKPGDQSNDYNICNQWIPLFNKTRPDDHIFCNVTGEGVNSPNNTADGIIQFQTNEIAYQNRWMLVPLANGNLSIINKQTGNKLFLFIYFDTAIGDDPIEEGGLAYAGDRYYSDRFGMNEFSIELQSDGKHFKIRAWPNDSCTNTSLAWCTQPIYLTAYKRSVGNGDHTNTFVKGVANANGDSAMWYTDMNLFQEEGTGYSFSSCKDGKCIDSTHTPTPQDLQNCSECSDCKWEFNSLINGYSFICDKCQVCNPQSNTDCKNATSCGGCTQDEGSVAGQFKCAYCDASDDCTVYNDNVGTIPIAEKTLYNTGSGYDPTTFHTDSDETGMCSFQQPSTPGLGETSNRCVGYQPDHLGKNDGGIGYEFITWILSSNRGECNGAIRECNVRN